MINLTEEQIIETLERLRAYSYWMYFGKSCKEVFDKQIIECDGKKYKIQILDNGNYKGLAIESGKFAIYSPTAIVASPSAGKLNNVEFKCLHVEGEKDEELDKLAIFVESAFQRAVSFTFFANMQDVTIKGIVSDLVKCNK